MPEKNTIIHLGDKPYEIVKETRLRDGMVLQGPGGETFARLGEKDITLEEEMHTKSLQARGFPVPEVIETGELPDGRYYFVEKSLGLKTFFERFVSEYRDSGKISDETFQKYLSVIDTYSAAQYKSENHTSVSAKDFLESCIPNQYVLQNYCYFGYKAERYLNALSLATQKLSESPMGILQFDLNPYNMLDDGVIDFELVGYGPLGFDALMSARWGGSWFTDYPSRYPVGYKCSPGQIAQSDQIIEHRAIEAGVISPLTFLQEFILIKSAWAVLEFTPPQPDWPQDRIAFRRYRSNVLNHVVTQYLAGEKLHPETFSAITGGELA